MSVQSMTEEEAREELASKVGHEIDSAHWQAVKEIFNLEFADSGPPRMIYHPERGGFQPVGRGWRSIEEMTLGYKTAVRRYNAYPDLWKAGERVQLASIYPPGFFPGPLQVAITALCVELAKGPKP